MNKYLKACIISTLIATAAHTVDAGSVKAEYFWDRDPGIGSGTAAALSEGTSGLRLASLSAEGLAPGRHLLGVRVNNSGQWSTTRISYVDIINTPALSVREIEYFWDKDPGLGAGTTATLSGGSLPSFSASTISTAGLAAGRHLLGIRLKTEEGWSTTRISYVDIINTPALSVREIEYFWDKDPGLGAGTAATITDGGQSSFSAASISATDLTPGRHLLGVRLKTEEGWSATRISYVDILDDNSLLITGAEYFWNEDPGTGMATAIAVTPGKEIELNNLDIPFPDYESDRYTLSFRFKAGEKWGATHSFAFENVALTGLSINEEKLEIAVEGSAVLTAVPEPEDALFVQYRWESSNENIVSVDTDGKVTGIAPGTATVAAVSARYPDIRSECEIRVYSESSGIDTDVVSADIVSEHGGIRIRTQRPICVAVFGVSGVTVLSEEITGERFVALQPGVYLVKTGGRVQKVLVD